MKNYGRASVHEILNDFIVYRNLIPLDSQLPPFAEIRGQLQLAKGMTPRKSEPAYASVIVHLLEKARQLEAPGTRIQRLVYVGDTRLNDGTAFSNIARSGGWPGIAFIAAEKGERPTIELQHNEQQTLYLANRWSAIVDFDLYCRKQGFPFDQGTAVVVDLDKTLLGARGRNDHVIDRARVNAVRRTVGALLGAEFDPDNFQLAYDRLNQAEFHPFTTDNQDYLAYICLILGSGLFTLESLVEQVKTGQLSNFAQFISQIDARLRELPDRLRSMHQDVFARFQVGDPTPFKAFRYNEYLATVQSMGKLEDHASAESMLEQEIVMTHEVREVAQKWSQNGALLFGLSDKPDEASIPTDDLASEGFLPIHRVMTHVVGEE